MDITATVWTLLPPIIAIALALITKEVYSSLLIGILAGALLYTGFNPLHAVETTFEIMGGKLGDNINICIFLVLLGILVSLVTKSGASRAYGEWAVKTIKSRRGASFATSFLGIFIFVDDYFNCLTVGTVMRPVTDKYSITRAKLAYIIDATAAPVCIIAPISSWAAAVGSSLPESSTMDGFSLFMKTIPMNLYAILTLIFLIWLMAADFDFAAMGKYAREHKDDDLSQLEENYVVGGAGKVYDLILPDRGADRALHRRDAVHRRHSRGREHHRRFRELLVLDRSGSRLVLHARVHLPAVHSAQGPVLRPVLRGVHRGLQVHGAGHPDPDARVDAVRRMLG